MSVIQRAFVAHLLVAVAALSFSFVSPGPLAVMGQLPLSDARYFVILFVFLGGLWFAAHVRGAESLASLILYFFMIAAGIGVLVQAPGWLMLLVSVASLGAWDLDNFFQRLRSAEKLENEARLWREHMRRLALVEGLGFLAGLAALTASFAIPFWWEALLALLVVIGIRRVIEFVRKEAD